MLSVCWFVGLFVCWFVDRCRWFVVGLLARCWFVVGFLPVCSSQLVLIPGSRWVVPGSCLGWLLVCCWNVVGIHVGCCWHARRGWWYAGRVLPLCVVDLLSVLFWCVVGVFCLCV